MPRYKLEDIRGFETAAEVVCADCWSEDTDDYAFVTDFIDVAKADDAEQLIVCDRCGNKV